jgi:hypothetical protein
MARKWKAGSSREMGVGGKTATSAKKVEKDSTCCLDSEHFCIIRTIWDI